MGNYSIVAASNDNHINKSICESKSQNLKRLSNELELKWGFHDLQFNDKTVL